VKLKKDINRALESSTDTVEQAVHEAERLRTKSELEVKNRVNELKMMLTQLQSIREQLGREFELKRANR
jgi:F0F1-type ATP synthase membrane subunit b/b'